MRFSEFVARNENVWLDDVIPLLQQIYINAHSWNIDDSIQKVSESKRKHVINTVLVNNIDKKIIKGELVYDYACDNDGYPHIDPTTNEPVTELKYDRSYVNVKSLMQYVVSDIKDESLVSDELLVVAGIKVSGKRGASDQGKVDPAFATELGTLRNEKLKWDASIKAATEIGLLFFEGELPKPTTRDAFVQEFNSKVGGLPDTTVEMIYKALPSEYRHKGGKPKMAKSETAGIGTDALYSAIKAAVYAGSIFDTDDAKDTQLLSNVLKDEGYQVPPADVLQCIVGAVKSV